MTYSRMALVLAVLTITACVETERPLATGQGTIRGIHASSTAPRLDFQIEERRLERLPFRGTSGAFEFDDLSYFINWDYTFTGDIDPTRLISTPLDLIPDTDYTFVYVGSLAEPEVLVWERPEREWDGTETTIELRIGHLSPEIGDVDVYLLPTGAMPVLGEATASLSYTEHSPQIELEAGDFDLYVTTRDDPADILWQSEAFAISPAANWMVALFDFDPSITAPFSVRLIAEDLGQSFELAEANSPPTMRAFHATIGTVPFDLYLDSDFSAPLHSNVAFGEVTEEADTTSVTVLNTYTEADNVGAVLFESELVTVAGSRNTRFLIGDPTTLDTILTVDNLRPSEDATRIRFIHTAFNLQLLDVYVVRRDEELGDLTLPFLNNFRYPGNSEYVGIPGVNYDIYITESTSQELYAGPIPLDLSPGDVSHIVILDTVDPTRVDVVEYDRASLDQPAPN